MNLILPGHVQGSMPPEEEKSFPENLMQRVYQDCPTDFESDEVKYRHAYTHMVVESGQKFWATAKKHDGCPSCNGSIREAAMERAKARAVYLQQTDPLSEDAQGARAWLSSLGKHIVNGEVVDIEPGITQEAPQGEISEKTSAL